MRADVYTRECPPSTRNREPARRAPPYAEARGRTAGEDVDHGVSGAKDFRPALDRLMKATTRRQVLSWSAGASTGSAEFETSSDDRGHVAAPRRVVCEFG